MAERKSIPYSERKFDRAHANKYQADYVKEHYDRVEFRLPKGDKQVIKDAAAKEGLPVSEWIRKLIDKELNM